MTTLGQAYVQIMPSAKGISGSIKSILDPEATSAGKSVGTQITKSIANTMSGLGKEMTKYITIPAMGAMTAVTGLVTALGFKRLIGMDNAQAKLKGLGIEGKQLEQVMLDAKNAVTGTTHTMAEGANTAAGALAAGVKEGKDLERFIKLVGDAASGSNRTMDEMSMIFNRVQGSGKLMTMELNQIEHSMPGFSQALAKHLGVAPEEMRKMVTAGKVSSEEFLDVMEDFAGGMSEAYASTWTGLKDNILANIGIIGEALLEGLFEDGKKGMADFLDFLRNSDGLKEWARETGEKIREVFNVIIEAIRGAINWWVNLDDGIKNIITTIAGFAIAAGPILMVLGKIVGLITPAITLFQTLGAVIGGLLSPVGLVIAAIVGGAALVYMHWEPISEFFVNLFQGIYEVVTPIVQAISDFIMEIFGTLTEWWTENSELMREATEAVWNAIQAVITAVLKAIEPVVKIVWDSIKSITKVTWDIVKTIIKTTLDVILGIVKTIMQILKGDWSGAWNTIKSTTSSLLNGIKDIISSVLNAGLGIIKGILNNIKSVFSSIFNGLKSIVSNAFNNVKDAVKSGITGAFDIVTGFFGKFKDAGKKIVTSIADGIKGAISKVTDAVKNVAQKIRDFLPFSPPKTGPLMDIMDVKWGETISGGIVKGESVVADAMDRILDFNLSKKADFNYPDNRSTGRESITINNTFTTKEFSPFEIARKQRQQLQQMAIGVRL